MAQETLNSLIQVMFTLSLAEQKRVIAEMQANVDKLSGEALTPYSMDEINARLDEAEQQIEASRFYTSEQVFNPQFVGA